MKFKLTVFIIFVLTVVTGFSAFASDSFYDDTVRNALKNNILENDKAYVFDDSVTREEFCEFVYNLIYESLDEVDLPDASVSFSDTTNQKIIVLAKLRIVFGKSDTAFDPSASLTREEAATIIGRTVDSVLPLPRHEMYFMFDDENEMSHWAKNAIQTVCNMGVMKAAEDNKFSPEGTVSVRDSIIMVMQIFDTYKANTGLGDGSLNTDNSFTDKVNSLMPDDKNYMFSPFSIKMALAMAANGAEGVTQSEILDALDITDLESYNRTAKETIAKYSQSELLKLNVANSIWINKDKTSQRFTDGYKSGLSEFFGATSDVVGQADAASKINGWVNDKTQGKIPSIIRDDSADFWAMLVNAVYFKGRWQNEFNKGATQEDIFFSKDGTEAKADFMHRRAWMSYSDVNGVEIVQLPYLTRESVFDDKGEYVKTNILKDMDVSMYLMMSSDNYNVEDTIKSAKFDGRYIDLSVPKFEVEYSSEITDILKSLGIDKAFGDKAEFNTMFDQGTMSIDKTIHKTYIKVDEEGTEAAAVTAVAMAGTALPPEPIVLKYNKPFSFVIRDNISGEILFIGEYAFCR